jgi:hypothetical protein
MNVLEHNADHYQWLKLEYQLVQWAATAGWRGKVAKVVNKGCACAERREGHGSTEHGRRPS